VGDGSSREANDLRRELVAVDSLIEQLQESGRDVDDARLEEAVERRRRLLQEIAERIRTGDWRPAEP
jgi:hypothetical protein